MNVDTLDARVAVVTGVSRGIRGEIARLFGREGARVAAVARTAEPVDGREFGPTVPTGQP